MRNQSLSVADRKQIQFLQNGLTYQDFVAKHQRFFNSIASLTFEYDRIGDSNRLGSTIGVFGHSLPASSKPKLFHDVNRQYRPHCTGVDNAFNLQPADLARV